MSSSHLQAKLIIENCDQIVQICSKGEKVKKGKEQDELAILQRRKDGIGCSLAVGYDGKILEIGYDDELQYSEFSETISGAGCSLVPGLIDSHTHPIWAGDRVFEFDLKLRGASYLEIHNKGGGIYYTVEQTRRASEGKLFKDFLSRLKLMSECGTTTVECKTGYGLDFESEVKMLDVIKQAKGSTDIDLVTTFLGAHAKPRYLIK